ncbi:MAG TPA: ABC transporter ATP-binding protein, partial [Pirellulaceae bacterium]|nr:ABC transporter ATP-binding protein [Pirellulaceae bacterium]
PRNTNDPSPSTQERSTTTNERRPTLVRWVRDPDRETDQRPLDLGLIRRLLGYMRPYAAKRNWLFLCVFLRGVQLPLVAWALGATINGPITRGDSFGHILLATAGVLALGAFTHVTFHFRYRLALELGESVMQDLRDELFAHLQTLPMSFFNRTKVGRIISRVTSDCEAMRIGVQDVLFVGLVGLGQMLFAASLMLYYDFVLFLVIAAMTPVLWVLNHYFRRRLSKAYRDVQESFSRVTATLAESVAGIRVTQGFSRQAVNAELFGDLVEDHARYNLTAAKTAGVFMPILELNSQLFIAALLVLGGYRALSPDVQMPVGDLIQFFFLAAVFFSPIQILGNQYNQALTAMAGAERVFRLLDTKPEWTDLPDAKPLPPLRGRVELDDVTFGYDPERPVLHDVSFTAEPGQTVALVGHTGSGKTSIINLIARFYLPTRGRVLLDGHDIRAATGDSLHHQMGIVLQQNFLFTGSIADNIRTGKPGASDEEVRTALERLDCLDLFESLPQGLATEVGERGGQLSLGQRQLVCFARAMLADPRIFILDEATSAVDTLTEERIQQALRRLLTDRTSFVVAHRLSTIRQADLILVLDQGRIVQRGTHDTLVEAPGPYSQLHRQFAASRPSANSNHA